MLLLLIPEYSGINKGQRVLDRSKTAHRKPLVKCFLTSVTIQKLWSVYPEISGQALLLPKKKSEGKLLVYEE